jgi:hypothetical protein
MGCPVAAGSSEAQSTVPSRRQTAPGQWLESRVRAANKSSS